MQALAAQYTPQRLRPSLQQGVEALLFMWVNEQYYIGYKVLNTMVDGCESSSRKGWRGAVTHGICQGNVAYLT